MKIFAISDLHLSTAVSKPMDIFGVGWENYFEKIRCDWLSRVTDEDVVLLGGDISWGISIEEATPDYALIAELPGKKVIVKGNHDYYWNSLSKMNASFPDFLFLQNNCLRFGNILVAGSRGWSLPTEDSEEDDKKIYAREIIRLKLSLDAMKKQRSENDKVIALLHYPPSDQFFADTEQTKLFEEYRVDKVLYGHLHGKNVRVTPKFSKNGIEYLLTSCDLINNTLIEVF